MTAIEQAARNALTILNALKGGDAPAHVWYEIGRAAMTLQLVLPSAPSKEY